MKSILRKILLVCSFLCEFKVDEGAECCMLGFVILTLKPILHNCNMTNHPCVLNGLYEYSNVGLVYSEIISRFVLYLCFAIWLHSNATPENHTALMNSTNNLKTVWFVPRCVSAATLFL